MDNLGQAGWKRVELALSGVRVKLRADEYLVVALGGRELPVPCHFCGKPVKHIGRGKRNGCVHHLDHDRLNNVSENLVVAHHSCHNRYHGAQPRNFPETLTEAHRKAIGDAVRGTVHSAKSRANMSAGAKRRFQDEEQRKLVGRGKLGVPKSAEHRAKLAEAQRATSPCPICGKEFNKTWMKRHKCER